MVHFFVVFAILLPGLCLIFRVQGLGFRVLLPRLWIDFRGTGGRTLLGLEGGGVLMLLQVDDRPRGFRSLYSECHSGILRLRISHRSQGIGGSASFL